MRLFRTTEGVARQEGADLHFLPLPNEGLDAILVEGRLFELTEMPATEIKPLADEHIWLPLLDIPSRFVIAGLNYHAHCAEIGRTPPEKLVFGSAPGTAIHSSHQHVKMLGEEVDYEGEIAVIIGKEASQVSPDQAWDYVAGIAPINDVSARDVQAEGTLEAVGQAKGYPTYKPMGPCFATPGEFADPDDLSIKTWVNGDLRQQGRTSDMIFPVSEIIATVTKRLTLLPGDVICTGTPGGVAHGGMYPYLEDGDVVRIQVADMPYLENQFIREA